MYRNHIPRRGSCVSKRRGDMVLFGHKSGKGTPCLNAQDLWRELWTAVKEFEKEIQSCVPKIENWIRKRETTIILCEDILRKNEIRSKVAKGAKVVGDAATVSGSVIWVIGAVVSVVRQDYASLASTLRNVGGWAAATGKVTSFGAEFAMSYFETLSKSETQSLLKEDATELKSIFEIIQTIEKKAAKFQDYCDSYNKAYEMEIFLEGSTSLRSLELNESQCFMMRQAQAIIARGQKMTNVANLAAPLTQKMFSSFNLPIPKAKAVDILSGVTGGVIALCEMIGTLDDLKNNTRSVTEQQLQDLLAQLKLELSTMTEYHEKLQGGLQAVNRYHVTIKDSYSAIPALKKALPEGEDQWFPRGHRFGDDRRGRSYELSLQK